MAVTNFDNELAIIVGCDNNLTTKDIRQNQPKGDDVVALPIQSRRVCFLIVFLSIRDTGHLEKGRRERKQKENKSSRSYRGSKGKECLFLKRAEVSRNTRRRIRNRQRNNWQRWAGGPIIIDAARIQQSSSPASLLLLLLLLCESLEESDGFQEFRIHRTMMIDLSSLDISSLLIKRWQ